MTWGRVTVDTEVWCQNIKQSRLRLRKSGTCDKSIHIVNLPHKGCPPPPHVDADANVEVAETPPPISFQRSEIVPDATETPLPPVVFKQAIATSPKGMKPIKPTGRKGRKGWKKKFQPMEIIFEDGDTWTTAAEAMQMALKSASWAHVCASRALIRTSVSPELATVFESIFMNL